MLNLVVKLLVALQPTLLPAQSAGVSKLEPLVLRGVTIIDGTGAPAREVLSKILSESTRPLTGSELAAKAIKAGYRSTSKSFVDVVWVSLGNMKNVEHVPDQGYRLKRSKTQRATSRS